MKEIYKEAFAEISEILKIMPKTMVDKIPNKFKEIIENEKSMTYISNIKEPLEQCTLKEETIIILSLIYRDFLCDKEEKSKLQYRDAQKIKEVEDEIREKYNPDNIFKNRNNGNIKENSNIVEEKSMAIIPQEKWYQKIFNIVKKLFKR